MVTCIKVGYKYTFFPAHFELKKVGELLLKKSNNSPTPPTNHRY